MNTFITAMALSSAFIALTVIQYLPSEMDRTKIYFACGVIYLILALVVCISGMGLTVLEFNA